VSTTNHQPFFVCACFHFSDRIRFRIKNFIPEGEKVTDEALKLLTEPPQSGRGNHARTPPHSGGAPSPSSSISTRLGLHHIALACKAANGSFFIKLDRGSQNAVLTMISLPCSTLEEAPTTATETTLCGPPTVRKISPLKLRKNHLIVGAIDDSSMICKGYQKLLLPNMGADLEASFVVCPEAEGDIERFMSLALGDAANRRAQADVVILDQNLDLTSHKVRMIKSKPILLSAHPCPSFEKQTVLGTDIAIKLRSSGFQGLVVVRSANSSTVDIAHYMSTGAVDCCLGKDQGFKPMTKSILQLLDTRGS
jgi:hypothetical protein